MDENKIKQIIKEEMERNYTSGSPRIPPHTHNGIDNLQIPASNILDLTLTTGSIGLTNISVYTSNGTFTAPVGITKVWVRTVGAGQGGGYAASSATAGSSGQAGDYSESVVDVTGLGTITVTVGSGGTGASSAGNGANGGDSSFGSLVVAKGGNSATTSVGDVTITSAAGIPSLSLSAIGSSTSVSILSAEGGSNPLGRGGPGVIGTPSSQTTGSTGHLYGGGGSGGASGTAGGTANGGNGANGLVIVIY